jgi:hypothetical protein
MIGPVELRPRHARCGRLVQIGVVCARHERFVQLDESSAQKEKRRSLYLVSELESFSDVRQRTPRAIVAGLAGPTSTSTERLTAAQAPRPAAGF